MISYWENKTTYWPRSESPFHSLDITHDTHRQSNDSWTTQNHTQRTVRQLSSCTRIRASAFTSSRVLDQYQRHSESHPGRLSYPLHPMEVGERWGTHLDNSQGGADSGWSDPWTDQGKQPFWRLFTQYSRDCPLISSPTFHRALQEPQCSMYVHVSTCRGSCIWVTSLQLHIHNYIRVPL